MYSFLFGIENGSKVKPLIPGLRGVPIDMKPRWEPIKPYYSSFTWFTVEELIAFDYSQSVLGKTRKTYLEALGKRFNESLSILQRQPDKQRLRITAWLQDYDYYEPSK